MQSVSSAGIALGAEVRASTSARVTYRPDIDGLRAISVLAVILFHSAVPGFTGGYVGVDVFFVISGYLITQVLMASPERSVGGRLRDFYVRRCRRILPALLAMLLARRRSHAGCFSRAIWRTSAHCSARHRYLQATWSRGAAAATSH